MKKRWRKIEYDLINKQQAIKEAVNNWKLSKRMLSVLGLAVTVFCITMIALLVFFRHRMKAQVLQIFFDTDLRDLRQILRLHDGSGWVIGERKDQNLRFRCDLLE